MFHDKREFEFVATLEANWQGIRDECRAVQAQMREYVERDLYDHGWNVFIMANFPHREAIRGNDVQCPFTSELVRRIVPRPGVICFSRMDAHTEIHPHTGYKGQYLRCHLGLEVPEGDCALKVGEEEHRWREGEALVFDDRTLHSAWNRTALPRTVLLFDFIP
jgi:beta-hydroxylase